MSGADNFMSEPRPAASLTGSLLARRGTARPAMRRPSLTGLQGGLSVNEDLGWNDMGDIGHDESMPELSTPNFPVETAEMAVPITPAIAPLTGDVAPVSPVKEQLQALAAEISARSIVRTGKHTAPASLSGVGRKAAFTLRLDPERHLRLRLLSAVSKRSAQQLLVEALDEMVSRNAKVQELAAQVEMQAPDK